ncbi:helix-turn-helix transcriptional regulator [Paenibacillus rigui]|uniref:HTH araC/xylS-type domain-containing protein n=1 Tax=Paenibacillus rigui TaxID=554312 RepID=A0A229UJQ3_9BACL|nr:AraC family transcriptional regulator [Paenibacillus rigui]OXM83622.1 hypothetical protein CF651_24670 [Paenibacillus rigui]
MNATPVRISLFRRMLASFVILILLFTLCDFLIFSVVKKHLHSEMVEQNGLKLQHAAERYHLHFERIKSVLFERYTDRDVTNLETQIVKKAAYEQLKTRPIVQDLQNTASQSELYLDNLILLFHASPLAVNKYGPASPEETLGSLYKSGSYPLSYWHEQFERKNNFMLHPAADFYNAKEEAAPKRLIPYSIKPHMASYMLIAMIDANRMQQGILGDASDAQLTVLSADQRPLFQTGRPVPAVDEQVLAGLAAIDNDTHYTVQNGNYYFASKDAGGLQYILTVPTREFNEKLRHLNWMMLLVWAVTVLLGLLISVLFSKRIHKPVRQLLSSISNPQDNGPLHSQIHEFDLISLKIQGLLRDKEDIRGELQQQQSVLTSFDYISKLKSINQELNSWQSIQGNEESFVVVLYELRFRPVSFIDLPINREQAAQSIGEHLKLVTDERFPNSHTFQMEKHQFLSVIPGNEKEQIVAMVEQLKPILDRDRRYCLVTAAISSWFSHASQFGHAYRQVQEMAQQAKLLEETQLVTEWQSSRSAYALTLTQEQELTAALQSGNEQDAVALVERWLMTLHQEEATVLLFRLLAHNISTQAQKILEHYKVEASTSWRLKPLMQQLAECCTLEEYTRTYREYLRAVSAFIREKKEAADPIIDHVMSLIQEHYAEDISLDILAGQLNLTPAYVSTYIKEKTGVNFMEHLHDTRVRHAQELLIHTDTTIQDIGLQVGYRNISSFNRMFKNRTGLSPGEYRRTHLVARSS